MLAKVCVPEGILTKMESEIGKVTKNAKNTLKKRLPIDKNYKNKKL